MIHHLDGIAKQTWHADDSAAASKLEQLRKWWDLLNKIGPLYGYFPNGSKTHILVKPQYINKAKEMLKDTSITIPEERKRYLGGGYPLLCSNLCPAESGGMGLDVISDEPGRSTIPTPTPYAAGPSTIPVPAPLPCRTFDGPSSRTEYEKAYRGGKAAEKEVEEAFKLYKSHRRIFNTVI